MGIQDWDMPPVAKVYEALSAVVDGRVKLTNGTSAEVGSSSGSKAYVVRWSEDLASFTSNDNASYFVGYLGYPIIAVLLDQGKLKYDYATAAHLGNVPWKQLNDKFKRDYDKAVNYALSCAEAKGADVQAIRRMVEQIYDDLQNLRIKKLQGPRIPPPKG